MITTNLIERVMELMACGKSLVQVAADLRMSKARFNNLLTSENENSDMQMALREAIELGKTLHESHFEEIYVEGMLGKIKDIKEGLVKAYFQNKFKWSDKLDTREDKVDDMSKLSDAEIAEKIGKLNK